MHKRILLAYDGSETGQRALLNCRDIAQWSHSELFLVAVMPPTTINVAIFVFGWVHRSLGRK